MEIAHSHDGLMSLSRNSLGLESVFGNWGPEPRAEEPMSKLLNPQDPQAASAGGNDHIQLRDDIHDKCKSGKQWREELRSQTNKSRANEAIWDGYVNVVWPGSKT